MTNEITIICVYNNRKLLKNLLDSIKIHLSNTFKIQFLLIDNSSNKYKSASEALNSVLDLVIYSVIIFTHQDIQLISDKFINDSVSYLNINPNTILGAAGALNFKVYSNMIHGIRKTRVGSGLKQNLVVQTVDECFFITTKKIFSLIKFDEKTCDGWHLYASDFCLTAKTLNIDSVILPASSEIYHQSEGILDYLFYLTMKKILVKHKRLKEISTTCIKIRKGFYYRFLYLDLKIIQVKLKSILNKVF